MSLRLEMLLEAKRKLDALGPPVTRIRFSEYVPPSALPDGNPHTDDMRAMVDQLAATGGIQKVPVAWRIGNDIFMHPTHREKLR